jgi:transposase
MFGLIGGVSIFLCARPTDMRKAYDGLAGEVREYLGQNPLSGSLFVFLNRRRDRMKILVWERHGYWLLCKRLEAGRFQLPVVGDERTRSLVLSCEQLMLIVEGIDLASIRQRKRFVLNAV